MKNRADLDFDELYNKYANLVFHIAMERMNDSYVAEDIAQEVFLRLDQYLKTFENDEHVKAWLIRVTSNLCTDYQRKTFPELRGDLDENEIGLIQEDVIDRSIDFWDAQNQIEAVFNKLYKKNKRWYKITMETYYGHKSNAELAEEFHTTPNALGSLQYRIRRWLGKELLRQNQDLKYLYDKICQEESDMDGLKGNSMPEHNF